MERFYIPNYGSWDKPKIVGLTWLLEKMKERGLDGMVLMDVKSFQTTLGHLDVIYICKERGVLFESSRTMPSGFHGPVFALYPTRKLIEKAELLSNITDLLVLEWGDTKQTESWRSEFNPAVIEAPQENLIK